MKFKNIEPCYSGGGIYIFFGNIDNKRFFIADTNCNDVRIVNKNPIDTEESLEIEWQEKHFIEDLEPDASKKFMKEITDWIIKNNPKGNYITSDIEEIGRRLKNE